MTDFHSAPVLSQFYEPGPAIDDPWGSSARAWQTRRLQVPTGEPHEGALKVIRPTRMDEKSTYQQFVDEVEALYELRNIPQVIRMYDWGFISSYEMPRNPKTADEAPIHRNERILSLRQAGVQAFADLTPKAMAERWRPYIVLELMERERSLYALEKENQKPGDHPTRRIPIHDVLEMCDQYIQLLDHIHNLPRPILYYDTKPAHTYWYGHQRLLRIIDWNVITRLETNKGSEWERGVKQDIALMFFDSIFPACTGVHPPDGKNYWVAFEPMNPRPPLDYGPLRNQVPDLLKSLLEKGLSTEGFSSLDEIARWTDLRMLGTFIGRKQFANRQLHDRPDRRQAHELTIAGLTELRQAEAALARAMALFEQAKQLNPIDPDAPWLAEKTRQLKQLTDRARFIHG